MIGAIASFLALVLFSAASFAEFYSVEETFCGETKTTTNLFRSVYWDPNNSLVGFATENADQCTLVDYYLVVLDSVTPKGMGGYAYFAGARSTCQNGVLNIPQHSEVRTLAIRQDVNSGRIVIHYANQCDGQDLTVVFRNQN